MMASDMNKLDKPEISSDGWRIINCLQAFLSATEIRAAIDQYREESGLKNRGYEATVKMHLFSFLIDVFGRVNVIPEVAFKHGDMDTGRYDFVVKVGNGKMVIELKAFATTDNRLYEEDYAKVKKFIDKRHSVENDREAFFVHYNHDKACCKTKTILGNMKKKAFFDGSTSYVVTENKIVHVGEEGWDTLAPSFFLTFHRAGINHHFN